MAWSVQDSDFQVPQGEARSVLDLPPALWVDEIERDDDFVAAMRDRAVVLARAVREVDFPGSVPREFHPDRFPDRFPCGWCRWRRACVEAG